MQNSDWSTFTKRLSYKLDCDTILDQWLTQDAIENWFLSKAEFTTPDGFKRDRHSKIEKGDTYLWMWHGSDTTADGEILETNHKDFLKFTFLGCVVTVTTKKERGESVLELIQHEIPLDDTSRMNLYVECTRGWTFYLTNLKSIMEGGIDLRNRNKELTQVINT